MLNYTFIVLTLIVTNTEPQALTFFHLYKTLVPCVTAYEFFAGFTIVFLVSVKIVVNVNTCQLSYAKIRGTSSRVPL